MPMVDIFPDIPLFRKNTAAFRARNARLSASLSRRVPSTTIYALIITCFLCHCQIVLVNQPQPCKPYGLRHCPAYPPGSSRVRDSTLHERQLSGNSSWRRLALEPVAVIIQMSGTHVENTGRQVSLN